ncbi:hypothetical protein ACFWH1_18595 [Streptomyces sp. NPDC127037]|uniref:hypothetical protein n=1 Tax=Streptomyces sp. NPDC127037 TaxID=3347113 RepID=UPI00364C84C8
MTDSPNTGPDIAALATRADVLLARSTADTFQHCAGWAAAVTLCAQSIERAQTNQLAPDPSAACPECVTATERIIAAREAEEARRRAPIEAPKVHYFVSTRDAYDETQWREDIRDGDVLVIASEKVVGFLREAWPAALTVRHGELHTLTVPVGEVDEGKYAESVRVAAERAGELNVALRDDHAPDTEPTVRQVDDMLQAVHEAAGDVTSDPDPENPQWKAALARLTAATDFLGKHHPAYAAAMDAVGEADAGPKDTARGCAPKNCGNADVGAALAVLDGLAPAVLTDEHDITEPSDTDLAVRGFAVEPRGHGLVAAYWLERGLARRRDDGWHGPALEALFDRFTDAGWAVEPLRPTSLCVFAHRPQPTA